MNKIQGLRSVWRLPALLAMALLLSACESQQSAEEDQAIRFGIARAPLTFDPRYASDSTATRINRLIYQALTDFGPDSAAQSELATWEQLSPRHYRFHLLPDRAPFHDGTPLNAEDVAATYRSILESNSASPHKSNLQHVERIDVLDPDTLDIHLSRPDFRLQDRMDIGILPRNLIDAKHSFDKQPIGSGALRYIGGKNDSHWRFERVADKQVIEFHLVADPTVRALKLVSGEIDLLQNDLPPEIIEYLGEHQGLTIQQRPGMTFAYLGFNMTHMSTGKLQLRLAVAQGIDREAIIRYLFHGNARLASSILRPGHWALAPDLPPIEYNPVAARALLAELGHGPNKPLRLLYKTSADPFRLRLATVLQSQLRAIGIDMKIQSHDWGTFYGDIKAGRFEMYSLAWTSLHSPDIFRYICHSESLPPRGANRGGFISAAMDRQIELIDNATDANERLGALHRVQQIFRDNLIYVPLWHEGHTMVHNGELRGYGLYSDGRYDDLAKVQWTTEAID